MLFKSKDKVSGKTLHTSRPLLLSPKQGYVRPETGKEWWLTTTTIWPVDELIRRRVRDWRRLTGETGHSGERDGTFRKDHNSIYTGTHSVFPAPLMEWILLRYGGKPVGSSVLDAFAGGPPRGIVSTIMGFDYHGFEVRQGQIDENEAAIKRLKLNGAHYYLSDGRFMEGAPECDVGVTCPPYFNLEVYSDQPDDISAFKSYDEFNASMWLCAHSYYQKLRVGAFMCMVVGPFRDKRTGSLVDFRAHTVDNYLDAGFEFHQEIILSKNFASAAKRSTNAWKGLKLVPRHEYLLVFRKVK